VPTADLEKYRVSNSEEQIGRRPVSSFSRDPENEFFLPRALAERRERLLVAPQRLPSPGEIIDGPDEPEPSLPNRSRGRGR
jgi:hypothetical protein